MPEPTPTRQSAVDAAGAWLDFNDSRPKLLSPEHRRRTVEQFVARDAQRRVARALDAAAARLVDMRPPVTVRAAPLGYRVLAASREQAVVETWEVVVRGALSLDTSTLLSRSRITLVWQGGWKVTDAEVEADPPGAWSASTLAAADRQFASFRHVP